MMLLTKFPPREQGIFRYVPHTDVDAYHRCGWLIVADIGVYHGEHRVMMEWRCECEVKEPK